MKLGSFVILSFFLFTSCLKKNDEINRLNTNIFDKDYSQGVWFNVLKSVKYINDFGSPIVRFEYEIPENKTPSLKGSFINVASKKANGDWVFEKLSIGTDGSYDGIIEFPAVVSNNYCFFLGIHNTDDDSVINSFEYCEEVH